MPDTDAFNFDSVLATCFTPDQIARLGELRVGVAGCGGLGSNCAIAMVRSGFRRLTLVDFDIVEIGNLNRQQYTAAHLGRPKALCLAEVLRAINPGLEVESVIEKLDTAGARACFAGHDIVIEAFDKAEAKAMLGGVFIGGETFYVTASGLCGIGKSDDIRIRRLASRSWLVGDGESAVGPDCLPYAPRVQIAAAKQADLALAWALGRLT